jgi:class 3 adenylate cyclase/predicted ATPase
MICVQCHAPNQLGALFCSQCGSQLSLNDGDSTGAPTLHGERRQITALFCDVVDSTKLAVTLDPEEYQDIIKTFVHCCSDVVAAREGYVSEIRGDGTLVIFGYSVSRGDESERAIRAALEVIDAIDRLSLPNNLRLQARIGIATGVAAIDARPGELAIASDALNLAARLQSLAEPNTVVISSLAKRLAGGFFDLIDLGLHNLKGFPNPVPAWRVNGIKPIASRFDALRPELTAFVGRNIELKQLEVMWEKAKRGDAQIVEVSGEAGIGKSRLINHAQHSLCERQQVAKFSCSPYHASTALYPVIEQLVRILKFRPEQSTHQRLVALRKWLAQAGDDFEPHFCWIAKLLFLPVDLPTITSLEMRQRTLEALLWWFTAVAKKQPLFIVVEDAQWIDPTSLQLAQMILNQTSSMSTLLIISFRPPYSFPRIDNMPRLSITLDRLNRADAKAMVTDVVREANLSPALIEQVIEKADGIPLFLEELTKMVLGVDVDSGYFTRVHGLTSRSQLPSTLHDSLTARLDQLAPAKRVAQIAAVMGREFPYDILAETSGLTPEALKRSLNQLVEAGLVYDVGAGTQRRFMFKHALVRDAAYESLLIRDRHELHFAIALALERKNARAELLAHHYTEAGSTSEALKYWGIASRRALQMSSNAESLSHAQRGIQLVFTLPDIPDRKRQELELRILAGWAYWTLKGLPSQEVEQTFLRAQELAIAIGDDAMLNYALRGLFVCHYARGELRTAYKLAEQEIALAQKRNDTGDLMLGRWALGSTSFWIGEFEIARRELQAAIDLYDPALVQAKIFTSQVDPVVNSNAHLSWTLWVLGFPDQAAERIQQAMNDARRSGNALSLSLALFWNCVVKICRGELADARVALQELFAVTARHRVAFFAICAIVLDGAITATNGEAKAGIIRIQQAINEFRTMRGGAGQPWIMSLIADAHCRSGLPKDAQAAVAMGLAMIEKEGERHWQAELYRIGGEAILASTDADIGKAEVAFRQAIDIAQRQKALSLELRATMSLARLLLKRGEPARARDSLGAIYSRFTEGFATADLVAAKSMLGKCDCTSSRITQNICH